MLSSRDVAKHAKQIVELTGRKLMPPWKALDDVHFLGERRLSPEQIDLIRRWAEQGCAEGDPAAAPKPPTFTAGWQLGEPDVVVSMSEPYQLAADGRDVYRCFVIPVKIPEGKFTCVPSKFGRAIATSCITRCCPHCRKRLRKSERRMSRQEVSPGFPADFPPREIGFPGRWESGCRERSRFRCPRVTRRRGRAVVF